VATDEDVRAIVRALPGTSEKPSYGTPGFRVKDRLFLRIRSNDEGGLLVWVADLAEKDALIASDPSKFFTTSHYDGHPTVIVSLEAVDVEELRELITEAWRVRAPLRVRQAFDSEA
jgi:hypothetical protein